MFCWTSQLDLAVSLKEAIVIGYTIRRLVQIATCYFQACFTYSEIKNIKKLPVYETNVQNLECLYVHITLFLITGSFHRLILYTGGVYFQPGLITSHSRLSLPLAHSRKWFILLFSLLAQSIVLPQSHTLITQVYLETGIIVRLSSFSTVQGRNTPVYIKSINIFMVCVTEVMH